MRKVAFCLDETYDVCLVWTMVNDETEVFQCKLPHDDMGAYIGEKRYSFKRMDVYSEGWMVSISPEDFDEVSEAEWNIIEEMVSVQKK